jgi:hypothetical protein
MPAPAKVVIPVAEKFDAAQSPVTDFILHLPVSADMVPYRDAVAASVKASQCRCGEWAHFTAGAKEECPHCGCACER